MHSREKVTYFLLGVVVTLGLVLLVNATTTGGQEGRYQLGCTDRTAFVIDTQTGVVKDLGSDSLGKYQLDKPFTAMQKAPDLVGP